MKAVSENCEAEQAELVKDEAMAHEKVSRPQQIPTEVHLFLYRLHERKEKNVGRRSLASITKFPKGGLGMIDSAGTWTRLSA